LGAFRKANLFVIPSKFYFIGVLFSKEAVDSWESCGLLLLIFSQTLCVCTRMRAHVCVCVCTCMHIHFWILYISYVQTHNAYSWAASELCIYLSHICATQCRLL
jgi:hypothetical protein